MTKYSVSSELKNITRVLNELHAEDADYTIDGKWISLEVFDVDAESGEARQFKNWFAVQRAKAYLETKCTKKYVVAETTYYEFEHHTVRAYATSFYM